MSQVLLMATSEGQGDRVPRAGCAQYVVIDPALRRPHARVVCPPCAAEEMGAAMREGIAIPVVACKPAAIEALRLFLAPAVGMPS